MNEQFTQAGMIVVVEDRIADKLDEMADICEYWKRRRERGRNPNAIRQALVMLSQEVAAMGPSNEQNCMTRELERLRTENAELRVAFKPKPSMKFLVTAKPIEWAECTPAGKQWDDGQYGFSITHDPNEDEGYRYHASWGEGLEDDFATLEEAKQWCQSVIDDWVRQIVLVTPNA